jgi:hypothetical protein
MSTPAAIQNRRHRENARRRVIRAEDQLRAEREEKEDADWLRKHRLRLKMARYRGSARVAKRFGKSAHQRSEERKLLVEAEGRVDGWEMDYITRLLTEARPRDISTVDGEWIPPSKWKKYGKGKSRRYISDPIEARMFGCFDGHKYTRYDTIHDLLAKELVKKNTGRWYFVHNGGRADFLFLIEEFLKPQESDEPDELVWKIDEKMAGGRIVFVNVMRGRWLPERDKKTKKIKLTVDDAGNPVPCLKWHTTYTWSFIDSTRIFQSTLAEIGRTVGLEKAKDEKTIAYLQKEFVDRGVETTTDLERYSSGNKRAFYVKAPLDVLEEYNQRDCEILWHGLDQYQVTLLELGGQMQKTGAACALDLFRRA